MRKCLISLRSYCLRMHCDVSVIPPVDFWNKCMNKCSTVQRQTMLRSEMNPLTDLFVNGAAECHADREEREWEE